MSGIYFEALRLTIPVIPVAQPRQRHRIAKMKDKSIVTNYTPKSDPVNTYKAALQLAVGEAMKMPPLLGPLAVKLAFYLPRPKSLMKKSSFAGPIPHHGKPDLDNLLKSTQDALNGAAWQDDSQIYCYASVGKWYCEKDGQPRVEIVIAADASLQQSSLKGASESA